MEKRVQRVHGKDGRICAIIDLFVFYKVQTEQHPCMSGGRAA